MPSIGDDDDDRDMAGSQDGSSDNDMDDTMGDMEDVGPEPDPESPSNSSIVSDSQTAIASQQNPQVLLTSPSPTNNAVSDSSLPLRPVVRPEALAATTYDIVPTTAAPHSTSINAVTATADMRWVFSGGSDGYVRKFNWVDSINSKLMLTVAQRHPFVDSVVKAGVLMTYWENMDGNALSPVYSLASHSQGLWLLSGLESGSIRLQSVRHDEGKEIALLQQHTSAVSVLCLTSDERSLISGSWDKRVHDWDLNVGQPRRTFGSSAGQISSIEIRPESSLPVPQESGEPPLTNGTYSSNTRANGTSSFAFKNGGNAAQQGESSSNANQAAAESPADSLFGTDSLFGDGEGGETEAPSGGAFAIDEDDEFSQALANGIQQPEDDKHGMDMPAAQPNGVSSQHTADAGSEKGDQAAQSSAPAAGNLTNGISSELLMNGSPHADDMERAPPSQDKTEISPDEGSDVTSDTTFFSASIDGTIRVWDRRQPNPIAKIVSRNAPPWCMNACWSPDGNFIYAGRRNGTVEEFSLHKGLRNAERTFKFPQGSGPVSAVRAMPNGRHLICASYDILRLYDLKDDHSSGRSTVPFLIVPGHRTGVVSQLYMDTACRYMISTGGNRGWEGANTEVLLGYEIGVL
ncbi:transcriptional activator SPT8 [[Emmonsia] crescens]|uniref:Transcriptional activator SPT8 n=1 Tax=[Emmonsia] crescens TaxID=73230 RepID=A0A0G2HPW0_9EURO|nr:transcriptional activator SPT8 [Emmonsia crescens UAMH 3008]